MTKKTRRVAKARRVLFSLSLVLVMMMVAVGGTLAWLTDDTDPVVNTFKASGIEVKLEETLQSDGSKLNGAPWEAKLVPGQVYFKDPAASIVKAQTDVDSLLFVKIEEIGNSFGSSNNKYFTYEIAGGWTPVDATKYPGVYYREVPLTNADVPYPVIKDDKVAINGALTEADMPGQNVNVQLKLTAYAHQLYESYTDANTNTKFAPVDAWENLNPTSGN